MIANIFVIGPAGSGKTAFAGAFREWMTDQSYDAIIVNLDPGVDLLPYTPDVDIREWISLDKVMEQYNLGPNGAQILAADLIANETETVKNEIQTYDTDYVIFDTPGQLELFAFRTSSEFIFNVLSEKKGVLTFMIDPVLASTATGFISQLLLSNTVFFRFYAPYINVLTKIDIIEPETVHNIVEWSKNSNTLYTALYNEKVEMRSLLSLELFKVLENMHVFRVLKATSAKEITGFEDVYAEIQYIYHGGEDLEHR